ncbi:hypothetical protein Tco_0840564 [Tanacetum coccineum]|uniref:Uncharacterized protein n=1 Tax=Tanacetum coccineum TaxID=301880 RepID=A0ABQ5AWX0_9ASTR
MGAGLKPNAKHKHFSEWSKSNVRHLIRILDCFHDASGLKINLDKSKLFGIGVSPEEVTSIARLVYCTHGSLPFIYLELPVGRSMKKIEAWNDVINKFTRRLSSWKANMLSIGGRLTLLKSVLDDEKKMVWVSWQKIMSSTKNGGLGVESIKAKNMGLMGKWKWRFLNESDALWKRVIVEFHGVNGGFDQTTSYMRNSGTWASIVKSCLELEHMSIDLDNLMERKVLSGNQTRFWTDYWIKNHGRLKNRFPRLYALETSKDCFVADRWVLEDGFGHAKWSWRRHPSGRASGELDLFRASALIHLNSPRDTEVGSEIQIGLAHEGKSGFS